MSNFEGRTVKTAKLHTQLFIGGTQTGVTLSRGGDARDVDMRVMGDYLEVKTKRNVVAYTPMTNVIQIELDPEKQA